MTDQVTKKGFFKVWDKLIEQSVLHQYHNGQCLFYEGHLPYGIFIIVSGLVSLVGNESNSQDNSLPIPLYHPVGFDILMSQQHYPFTATAQNDVKAVFIAKSSLDKFYQLNESVTKGKK